MASAPPGAGSSNMGMIIPAAISAGASLGGAALGGKGQKKAAQMQMQSQDKALGFAREQEMRRRQDWQQALMAYNQNRNALLQRYGISIPTQAPMGGAPVQPMGQAPQFGQPGGGYLRGGTLRDILQA